MHASVDRLKWDKNVSQNDHFGLITILRCASKFSIVRIDCIHGTRCYEKVQHLFDDSIAKNVIEDAIKLHEVLNNMNNTINDKSIDAFDFLLKGISDYDKLVSSGESQLQDETHKPNLERNLSSMGLEIDPVSGDGDCAFSSIITQLYKLPEFRTEEILTKHLQDIGLNIDEKTDAFTLRQQFVDHVQANEHYQLLTGISADKVNEETELFREKGTFCGNLGDLVIKVCSDILRFPILVITSMTQHRFVPFIPDDTLAMSTIYIAYNSHGPGHYDGVCSAGTCTCSYFFSLCCFDILKH